MKKFDKVFKSIIKEDHQIAKYIYDDQTFDTAFRRTWNSSDTRDMKYFFKKGTTVQRMKDIYKEICQKVSEGDYKGAYKSWTKVNTDGFLFRLMWAQGWDCKVPKSFNNPNAELKFVPHVASESVIKEDTLAPHVKKMQGYYKKDSDPKRLIKSIDNPDKLINRWLAAIKIGWTYAAEEFEKAIRERGLLTDDLIAAKKSQYTLDDSIKVPERSKEENRNLSSWTTRSVYLALQKICEERNYKFELKHSKNWNAVTDTGKEMMARNGRAWTVGYELIVTNEGGQGREVHYDLDVVTNEGGGLYGYVWGMQQYWKPTSLKQLIHDMLDSFDVDFEGKKRWGW